MEYFWGLAFLSPQGFRLKLKSGRFQPVRPGNGEHVWLWRVYFVHCVYTSLILEPNPLWPWIIKGFLRLLFDEKCFRVECSRPKNLHGDNGQIRDAASRDPALAGSLRSGCLFGPKIKKQAPADKSGIGKSSRPAPWYYEKIQFWSCLGPCSDRVQTATESRLPTRSQDCASARSDLFLQTSRAKIRARESKLRG